MARSSDEIHAWLAAFARCVRERDYRGGRALFSPDVRSFGTVADAVHGLDALVERQWRPAWSTTREFFFETDRAEISVSEDDRTAWVAIPWRSTGIASSGDFPRNGRATLLLERHEAGWRAVHSHFSLRPEPDEHP